MAGPFPGLYPLGSSICKRFARSAVSGAGRKDTECGFRAARGRLHGGPAAFHLRGGRLSQDDEIFGRRQTETNEIVLGYHRLPWLLLQSCFKNASLALCSFAAPKLEFKFIAPPPPQLPPPQWPPRSPPSPSRGASP